MIVRLFQDAVRVYMSATPYECLEYIIKCEDEEREKLNLKNYGWDQYKWKYGKMVFYHFKRDYSYLDVKTYSSISELYGEIVESVSQGKEKWLIFIDDIEKCAKVKAELEKVSEDMKCPLKVEENGSRKKVEKVFVVNANSNLSVRPEDTGKWRITCTGSWISHSGMIRIGVWRKQVRRTCRS